MYQEVRDAEIEWFIMRTQQQIGEENITYGEYTNPELETVNQVIPNSGYRELVRRYFNEQLGLIDKSEIPLRWEEWSLLRLGNKFRKVFQSGTFHCHDEIVDLEEIKRQIEMEGGEIETDSEEDTIF